MRQTIAACAALLVFASAARAAEPVGWRLIWADEFAQPNNDRPASTNWVLETGSEGWGNNELQTYTDRPENVRIENGMLVIEARKEKFKTARDKKSSKYTSGRLKTFGKQSWKYGRMEARMKLPRGQGIWPAFWMLSDNVEKVGWPDCGEIDIMENVGKEPTTLHGTIHGPGYSGLDGIGGKTNVAWPFADEFHTFAIEWSANRIDWLLDDKVYFTATPDKLPAGKTWVFDQPYFIILNLAVGGDWPGKPDDTTKFPQKMEIDYVRVYSRH